MNPIDETDVAVFNDCLSHPLGCTILPFEAVPEEPVEHQIFVMRTMNPQQAYVKTERPSICLDHHAPGWGYVHFCFVIHRVEGGDPLNLPTFQCPAPNQVQHVAVKQLARSVVDEYLNAGGHENPYTEVSRAQQYGQDNLYVLGCIEALQDHEYLYIISPMCVSLEEEIPWRQRHSFSEERAIAYFDQLLQILQFLQREGICHRDLTPGNTMIYQGRLVVSDMAMSFRIPPPRPPQDEGIGQQAPVMLVRPQGKYGKNAYLPPEVRHNLDPFDPYACDLWSCMVTLFNLVTGELLYKDSFARYHTYYHFVMAHGCSRRGVNRALLRIYFLEVAEARRPRLEDSPVLRTAHKVMLLSDELLELFGRVIQEDPQNRWNLAQVQEWMQNYRERQLQQRQQEQQQQEHEQLLQRQQEQQQQQQQEGNPQSQ
jgi:serine/threonine protein kinase